jgi:ribosomal protein L31E
MAKEKKLEPKLVLERQYIVPLRSKWLKVAKHKRANKAVKALKEFMVRHMKIYDRDLRKIKIDEDLNNEIRFRGMRKPLSKIKVKAKKYDNEIVKVELIEIPTHIKFKRLREEKDKKKIEETKKEKKEEKEKVEVKEEKVEEKKPDTEVKKEEKEKGEIAKEKEEASKEESLKLAKEQAKMQKHVSKDKKVMIRRRALSR